MEKIPWMLYRREDRLREPERSGNEFRSELDYLRGLYPVSAKKSQILAEEACDLLEYPESPMYDETAGEKEEQDLLQVMLVNEIYRRRILKRAVTDRQSEETGR